LRRENSENLLQEPPMYSKQLPFRPLEAEEIMNTLAIL
jgi:hypothetical protein